MATKIKELKLMGTIVDQDQGPLGSLLQDSLKETDQNPLQGRYK